MRKICYITTILSILVLTFSSCNIGSQNGHIEIQGITDANSPMDEQLESDDISTLMSVLKEPIPMNLSVKVESTYRKDIELNNAAFIISNKNRKEILEATFTNRVVIPKQSTSDVPVDLVILFKNPTRLISMALLGSNERIISKLYITGSFTIRMGLLRKRYTVQMMPLDQFIGHIFELEDDGSADSDIQPEGFDTNIF